jgi:mono/diheme cytochrome c family protein
MKLLKMLFVLALLAMAGASAFVVTGAYDVAADTPHWPATYRLIDFARTRSVAARAADVVVPDLGDAALLRSGAGNYAAMCVSCHLSPDDPEETELSLSLYPRPPRWDALGNVEPRIAFWTIKHGIKASGMPAWGRSMDDRYLWGMVAFLRQLPGMSAERYRAAIAASPGHSHGGGETDVGGGDPHAPPAAPTPRSSFEPVDDPMSAPAPAQEHHDHHH